MVLLQIGSMPRELAMKNTELFGKEVLPHLRDLWPGYEDRWWPQGAVDPAANGPGAAATAAKAGPAPVAGPRGTAR
jgi:hypothetical protein